MKNDKVKEKIGLYKGLFFTFIAVLFSLSGSLVVSFRANNIDLIAYISIISLPIVILVILSIYSKILELIDRIKED